VELEMPDVANVSHRYVDVNGSTIHVAEAGEPDAPVVVLLHGFPQHWYMWRDVIGPLALSRRVLAVDFRGFGWSDAPTRSYSTGARVRDVLAVLDSFGIASADVVGHDWGALVAFCLARDHPDRVNRLVGISMVHLWPIQRRLAPSVWRWWVTALFEWPGIGPWLLRTRPELIGWLLSRDCENPHVWTDELKRVYVQVAAEPARAKAAQRLHLMLVVGMPRLFMGRGRRQPYAVPTLVIGGEHDALIPPSVLTVPTSRSDVVNVVMVPGGHFLVDENPAAVTQAIQTHVDVTNRNADPMTGLAYVDARGCNDTFPRP
jgi:pimeloyl-ACP methyl ester carboxylesterase